MASFGGTFLDRIRSEISRSRARSSLSSGDAGQRGTTTQRPLGRTTEGGIDEQAAARSPIDHLFQGRIGPGRPPTHHGDTVAGGAGWMDALVGGDWYGPAQMRGLSGRLRSSSSEVCVWITVGEICGSNKGRDQVVCWIANEEVW